MNQTRKAVTKGASLPGGLLLGGGASLITTLILSVIGGKMVDGGVLSQNSMGYVAMAVIFIAAFTGSVIAMNRMKEKRLMVSTLSAGVYYLLLLGMTALFFGGQYKGLGVTALLVLAGAVAPALLIQQGRGGVKRKHFKMRSR